MWAYRYEISLVKYASVNLAKRIFVFKAIVSRHFRLCREKSHSGYLARHSPAIET